MSKIDRAALKAEWEELFKQRKATSDPSEKAKLHTLMVAIEKKMTLNTDRGIDMAIAENHISISVAVFQGESCYHGPTSHGHSLGDGNYWNRSGKH